MDPRLPLEKTFELLTAWPHESMVDCIRSALREPNEVVQGHAVDVALTKRTRALVVSAVEFFDTLAHTIQEQMVDRMDEYLSVLRTLLTYPSAKVRRNSMEILSRVVQPRLTYLYIQGLNDADEAVVRLAADALHMVTADFRLANNAAGRGMLDFDRDEMEAKKYSVLDPLLTALKTPRQQNKDVLMDTAIGLDRSADSVLARILLEPHDPMARKLLEILWSRTEPHVIAFLVRLLAHPRLGRVAASLVGKRTDLDFALALLDDPELNRPENRTAIAGIREFRWLEPDAGILGTLSSHQAMMAVQLVVMSGLKPEQKIETLERFRPYHADRIGQELTTVLNQLTAKVPLKAVLEEIAMMIDAVASPNEADHLGGVPVPLVKQPGEESPQVEAIDPDSAQSANLMMLDQIDRNRVSFSDFIEQFDRLDPDIRKQAAMTLYHRDPSFPLKLLAELSSDQSRRRIRGLKLVQMLDMVVDCRGRIVEMLADIDSRIRATATKLAGQIREPEITKKLLRMVTDHDHRVCANAIESLSELESKQTEDLLKLLTRHSDNRIRANALVALNKAGSKTVEPELRRMLQHDKSTHRISALWVVKEIDFLGRLSDLVLKMVRDDPDFDVRERARHLVGDTAPKVKEGRT